MPVYHFILHAYGSWHPDNPRGWHQHDEPGTLKADLPLGKHRRKIQRFESIEFSPNFQRELLIMVLDICSRRQWRCHMTTADTTHIHIIASWRGDQAASLLNATFKRLLGWRAAKFHSQSPRPWLSDRGKPQQVRDAEHLHTLLTQYLPNQTGLTWKEGNSPP